MIYILLGKSLYDKQAFILLLILWALTTPGFRNKVGIFWQLYKFGRKFLQITVIYIFEGIAQHMDAPTDRRPVWSP